jgi:hypothetical protein
LGGISNTDIETRLFLSAARAQDGPGKKGTTMDLTAYHLIAYEVGTDSEALNWPNVAPTHRFHSGDVIEDRGAHWQVVGVRDNSTEQLWLVDVKRVGKV